MSRINVDTVLARSPYGCKPVAIRCRFENEDKKKVREKIEQLSRMIANDKRTLEKHIEQRQELIEKYHNM